MSNDVSPKWAKEIVRFLAVKSQFILWGNIYDVYPVDLQGSITTLNINDYLKTLLKDNGYSLVLNYEPLNGFSLLEGSPDAFQKISGESLDKDKKLTCTLGKSAELIEKISTNEQENTAIVLNFASRLPDIAHDDMNEFYYKMFRYAHSAKPTSVQNDSGIKLPKYNLLIWLLDKENDLPAWYTLDNAKIKILTISKPDYYTRRVVIENLVKYIAGFNELEEVKKNENISLFIDQTNGLHSSEIVSIVSLARRQNTAFSEIGDAIRMYKLGVLENPWTKLAEANREKIVQIESKLAERVKGQEYAVRKASDIIKRSVFNLSGSQYSKHSQRPKGVLFFAGPTGVGKTELAKAITEQLFGSETSYIRFDMSEYGQEHADQRLVGAPPGYVGYDTGGQLTNSIKQNPFSVVLFDEIEKAHQKILDMFLQILDDGRLTSGRGETVYFSECLIIFTSNLGIYEHGPDGKKVQKIKPGQGYEHVSREILAAIQNFFNKIERPEILNRIGENIVVFDYIQPKIAEQIFGGMLKNVVFKLEDSYSLKVEITDAARAKLEKACCSDLAMGGRGIGNKLEEAFINPLSRALFEANTKQGERILIDDVENVGLSWNLKLRKISA